MSGESFTYALYDCGLILTMEITTDKELTHHERDLLGKTMMAAAERFNDERKELPGGAAETQAQATG